MGDNSREFLPVLLDFGLTKELPEKTRRGFALMVVAAANQNYEQLLESFQAMGLVLNREAPEEDMKAFRFLFRDTAPPKQARSELMAYRKEARARRKKKPRHLRNPVEAWPSELIFFLRTMLLLRGLCSELEVKIPIMELMSTV